MTTLAVLSALLAPAALIVLCRKWPPLDKLGLVLLAFGSGILISVLGALFGWQAAESTIATQTQITEIAIALALPLLVFSVDVRAALSETRATLISMVLVLACVSGLSLGLATVFAPHLSDMWQIAGLAVGAYTGGGPNMAAVKTAIDGDQAVFVTMTTYDILLSAIYLLFILALGKPLFGRLLRAYHPSDNTGSSSEAFAHMADESAAAYLRLCQRKHWVDLCKALGLAVLVLTFALALSALLPENMRSAGTIILITTLGLAFSFITGVRRLKVSFHLGMYLVLVFCFTMGSMTDTAIFSRLNWALFAYIAAILLGSLLLHAVLCRILKIDVDTFLVTSAAAIMSVPFIPVVVGALRNPALLVPGFAAAILGYALGNYLGIAVAYGVRALLGG
ncbi:MAG: DUF819 family protein [Salinisphaeraceae bacterium]|nr:DUF819 family protein [Salinisphaeraceae bacterium]